MVECRDHELKDPDALVKTEEERLTELRKMGAAMMALWNERVNAPPAPDLISMLAHGEATRNMDPMEFMGNCVLLIVGGNDTTRNSISGGLWALNKHPDEYRKLRENPGSDPQHGAGDHSLADAARVYAADRAGGLRAWRQDDPRG